MSSFAARPLRRSHRCALPTFGLSLTVTAVGDTAISGVPSPFRLIAG